jgi:hypothetical protein
MRPILPTPIIAQAQRLRAQGHTYWEIAGLIPGLSTAEAYYAVNVPEGSMDLRPMLWEWRRGRTAA